jgi:hypothetical protein
MRMFTIFALAMTVSLGVSADAFAGKKGKDEASDSAEADLELEESGIDSVDELFAKAKEPIDTIRTARMKVDAVAPNLNKALDLPEGTPFADALADLKGKAEGKIEVGMNGDVPTLKAADGVPANVQNAIDGLNTGIKEAIDATMKLSEVPAQVQEVIAAAKSFDPKSIKPVTAVPKATKALTGNMKVLGKAPAEVEALVQAVDNMKNDLTGLKG